MFPAQVALPSIGGSDRSVTKFLSGLARSQQWQHAAGVLQSLGQQGVRANAFHYGACIHACEKANVWMSALGLFRAMFLAKTEASIVNFNSAISACEKVGRWPAALDLLQQASVSGVKRDTISYNSAISACEKAGRWLVAVDLLLGMTLVRVARNHITYNAAISACEKSRQGEFALYLLKSMTEVGLEADTISYNAAISASEKAGHWSTALDLLEAMSGADVELSTVSLSASISACAKAGHWKNALALLRHVSHARLQPSGITFCAAISACERVLDWKGSLELLTEMGTSGLNARIAGYSMAAGVCDKTQQWQLSLWLLQEGGLSHFSTDGDSLSAPKGDGALLTACNPEEPGQMANWPDGALSALSEYARASDLSQLSWRLAKLGGPIAARAARLVSSVAAPQISSFRPAELSCLVWSFATLAVADPVLLRVAALEAKTRLGTGELELQGLANLAWAFASLDALEPGLLKAVKDELVVRAEAFHPKAGDSRRTLVAFAEAVLAVLWACHFAEAEAERTGFPQDAYNAARQALQRVGYALGQVAQAAVPSSTDSTIKEVNPLRAGVARTASSYEEPHIALELADRLVIMKPAGWQVDTKPEDEDMEDHADGQPRHKLSRFVQSVLPHEQYPILRDVGHQYGFLHRIDVPCSGLVLVAKTHEAFYDLQLQLATGMLERDYVVLCHGFISPRRQEIQARVRWWTDGRDGASTVKPDGRPARTRLKVLGRMPSPRSGEAMSLLALRISTGRRHQIRLHLAHVGHPTVCDSKYASKGTSLADLTWCPRLFLHRYRLAFHTEELPGDASSSVGPSQPGASSYSEVIEQLPSDLDDVLRQLDPAASGSHPASGPPKEGGDIGLQLKAWHDYSALRPLEQ
ncbi:unnamed protein product, partial [Polarella glacialis]